jgi:hypothetical protein
MNKKIAKEFDALERAFMSDLSDIQCSTEDYIEALENIIGSLEIAKDAAQQDLKRQEE